MDEHVDNEALSEVRPDRRAFVKRVIGVTAFAAPFIASYDLSTLSASAQPMFSNTTISDA